jgi:hypothetical protein
MLIKHKKKFGKFKGCCVFKGINRMYKRNLQNKKILWFQNVRRAIKHDLNDENDITKKLLRLLDEIT